MKVLDVVLEPRSQATNTLKACIKCLFFVESFLKDDEMKSREQNAASSTSTHVILISYCRRFRQ